MPTYPLRRGLRAVSRGLSATCASVCSCAALAAPAMTLAPGSTAVAPAAPATATATVTVPATVPVPAPPVPATSTPPVAPQPGTPAGAASMPNTSDGRGRTPPATPQPQPTDAAAGVTATGASGAATAPDAAAGTAQRVTSVHHLVEYRLDNGLRLVLGADATRPATSVNLVYRVGSRHEGPGEAGMAHLLEHMMFKGTPATPDPKTELTRRGLRWNATTSYDRTNYYAQFPSDAANLHWYLSWLADTMTGLTITAGRLDSERSVVLSEMQSGENSPSRILFQLALSSAFRFHPYGRAVIGTPSDLDQVRPERLQSFYRAYYRPDNAVLVVTGQFDEQAVLRDITALFGPIARPAVPLAQPYTLDAAQEGEREVVLRRVGGNPIVEAVYHMPAGATREAVALGALADTWSREPDGALYRTLVQPGLAVGAGASPMALADPGVLRVVAVLPDAARRDDAWDALRRTVEEHAAITPEALARTQQEAANQMREMLESPDTLAMQLTESIALGDWRLVFAQAQWLQELTVDEVEQAARRWLLRDNRTLAWYLPTERPQRAPAPERVDAAKLLADVPFAQSAAFEPDWAMTPQAIDAHVQRADLSSGMKVAVVPRRTPGDRVSLQMGLHWGDVQTLTGRWRDAELMSALMMAGTTTLERQALEDRLRALDARLDVRAQSQGGSAQLQVPLAHFDEALDVLADVLQHPAFPQAEFDEQRRAALASLRAAAAQPESGIADLLTEADRAWPPQDPRFVRTSAERAADLEGHTIERVRAFHRDFVGGSTGEVAVVGPVDAQRVHDALERRLGGWRNPGPYARIVRPLRELPPGERFRHFDDKQNAVLLAAQRLPVSEDSPDYPATAMAVRLLGGDASARIGARVREAEGLSYGAYASLSVDRREPVATLAIRAIHAPANVDRLREALAGVLHDTLASGFTQAELDGAKTASLQRRRAALVDETSIAALVAGNLQWGDTMQRWTRMDDAVQALTLDDVHAALRRHLDPARLLVVGAGNYPAMPQPLPASFAGRWPAVAPAPAATAPATPATVTTPTRTQPQ